MLASDIRWISEMRKYVISGVALFGLLLIGFLFLLNKASPENAPQDEKVIELPDTFEK